MYEFLNKLPLNNWKTEAGVAMNILVLGLWGTNVIDSDTALFFIGMIQTWTGVALAHRIEKKTAGQ